jgi:hypothetical protein
MVREPWIAFILEGKKTWEIRGTNTNIRGEVFLAASGTGTILGKATLAEVIGPLSPEEFRKTANLHLTSEEELQQSLPYRKTYAWVFQDAQRFPRPLRYRPPSGAITWVTLKDFNPGTEYFTCVHSNSRQQFLDSIAIDIRKLGHDVDIVANSKSLTVNIRYRDEKFEDISHVRSVYRAAAEGSSDVCQLEKPIEEIMAPDWRLVRPEIAICRSPEDKACFDRIRRMQGLPTSAGMGRYINAILWDKQSNPPHPMGVIGLSGASYAIQSRDDFLGWSHGNKAHVKQNREEGLKRIMHLSVCAAAPPYNRLRVARLLALLALSEPISTEFFTRYGDYLVAITTTSAFGLHGSIFRRIRPNRLRPATRYKHLINDLYHRIGETSGEYFAIVSDQTRDLAAELLRSESPDLLDSARGFGDEGVVKKAMMHVNLPRDLFRFIRMGFFLGYLHRDCLDVLRGNLLPCFSYSVAVEDCVRYWRSDILRCKSDDASTTVS